MKLITEFEQNLLTGNSNNRSGKTSYFPEFVKVVSGLEVGNGKLFIQKEEWYGKGYSKGTKPYSILCSKETNRPRLDGHPLKGKDYKVISYKEGWVIERIK